MATMPQYEHFPIHSMPLTLLPLLLTALKWCKSYDVDTGLLGKPATNKRGNAE